MSVARPSIVLAACDEKLAGIYGRKFEHEGWLVEVVASVQEAEHASVQLRPSVMLLDASCSVDMAREVKRLKALPTLLRTKIVILAAQSDRRKIDAALAAGASDYLLVGHFVPIEAVAKMKRLVGV